MTAIRLRESLETWATERGCSMTALTVMSSATDPYRVDTPANRRDAQWLADAWARSSARRPIHLRGLHYVFVSTPELPPTPTLGPYLNTDPCWIWLQQTAGRARWLGMVPFGDIVDERNSAPEVYTDAAEQPGECAVSEFVYHLSIPSSVNSLLPTVVVRPPEIRQPYRLVFIGEKQSLAQVLLPIVREHRAELVLPTGELSTTLLYGIVRRASEDGRPCRIFYCSDFDPTGFHMPIEVSRKLQALVEQFFPDIDLQLRRCALTHDHVATLGLPSTPLKETERRATRWLERFGVEQTEIDALATLRPQELAKIVYQAIAPYWDPSLDARILVAKSAAQEQAQVAWREIRAGIEESFHSAELALDRARTEVSPAEAAIRPLLDDIRDELRDALEDVEVDEPEPEVQGDVDGALFCSGRDWVDQTLLLRGERL